jgi:formylglycine-generating enzyme required for sulfatase activity
VEDAGPLSVSSIRRNKNCPGRRSNLNPIPFVSAQVTPPQTRPIGKPGWSDRRHRLEGRVPLLTVRVDSFELNPWGLYQVHGNVWEWCEDNWHENYEGVPPDGSIWAEGDTSQRVLRGGSWFGFAEQLRSADRLSGLPNERHDFIGFSLARTL